MEKPILLKFDGFALLRPELTEFSLPEHLCERESVCVCVISCIYCVLAETKKKKKLFMLSYNFFCNDYHVV